MAHNVSEAMFRAERTIIRRAGEKGLWVVFSGPEADREWLVKDRATDTILGSCYPNRGTGTVLGEPFTFVTIADALRTFAAARPNHKGN